MNSLSFGIKAKVGKYLTDDTPAYYYLSKKFLMADLGIDNF